MKYMINTIAGKKVEHIQKENKKNIMVNLNPNISVIMWTKGNPMESNLRG